jgi:hypothetical protein
MKVSPIFKGLATYVPGLYSYLQRRSVRHTVTAEYCYGVWLKHITLLSANGMNRLPADVAELGPGGSLGVGLAALLCGVERYRAFDIVRYTNVDWNLNVLDDLVELFRSRAPRPRRGWPDYDAHLDSSLFPHWVLTEEVMEKALAPSRVDTIREAVRRMDTNSPDAMIRYVVPWYSAEVLEAESIDLLLSHAVLEHIDDLETTYAASADWIRPGGWMSHQIDFRCHGLTEEWNGQWKYSPHAWRLIRGRRPYLINRQPFGAHLSLAGRRGFVVRCALRSPRLDGISRSQLAAAFADLPDEDLVCSGGFFVAQRLAARAGSRSSMAMGLEDSARVASRDTAC